MDKLPTSTGEFTGFLNLGQYHIFLRSGVFADFGAFQVGLIKCFQDLVIAQFCGNHPPEMHKDLITCDSFSEISNSSFIKHSPCNGHDQPYCPFCPKF